MHMIHLPILRHGVPYRSVDVATVVHHRTRQPFVLISQANTGLIRRDLLKQDEARAELAAIPARELIAMAAEAAELFMTATLPLDPLHGVTQSPQEYVEQLSATTGLPHVLVRRNMRKIHGVLSKMGDVIARSHTRPRYLGARHRRRRVRRPPLQLLSARALARRRLAEQLARCALALGARHRHEDAAGPQTRQLGAMDPVPHRLCADAAGVPKSAFCLYPADHAGGGEVLRSASRGMFFGDAAAARRFKGDSRVEVHGPGYSKVVIGKDRIDQWQDYLEVVATSMADNGGRSCVNARASGSPATQMPSRTPWPNGSASVVPRAADDEQALLAPFADAGVPATRLADDRRRPCGRRCARRERARTGAPNG